MPSLAFMAILFMLALVRAFYMRHHAHVSSPYESCNTVGVWYVLLPLLLLPFFTDMALNAFNSIIDMPYLVFIGLMKGVGFWGAIYCGQTIRKTSNSSAGFSGFVCIGLIAIGNGIFGEELSIPQWVSVSCLFLLGLYFYFKGHLSTQSSFVKLLFLFQIAIGCMFGMIDHYFLSHGNWFGLLFLTGVGMVGMALACGQLKFKGIALSVFDKKSRGFGAFQSLSEVVILSIFVTHLPVTLGWIAMTLATVGVMIFAAIYWGEGRWQQQFAVGGASYLSVLPVMLN